MSEDDDVMKLHNKGAIVDGESVLISSINWGDSAMVRNREMGLIITSAEVAEPYIQSWYADWNRLDNVTDTDNDGMQDIYEVNYGESNRCHTSTVSWNPMQTTTMMVFPISMNTRLAAIRSIQILTEIAFWML